MRATTHRTDPYQITVVIEDLDQPLTTQKSYHSLRETLQLAWELAGGIPYAWVGIRKHGQLRAELQTGADGMLTDAEILHRINRKTTGLAYDTLRVIPLNPRAPLFESVFAK